MVNYICAITVPDSTKLCLIKGPKSTFPGRACPQTLVYHMLCTYICTYPPNNSDNLILPPLGQKAERNPGTWSTYISLCAFIKANRFTLCKIYLVSVPHVQHWYCYTRVVECTQPWLQYQCTTLKKTWIVVTCPDPYRKNREQVWQHGHTLVCPCALFMCCNRWSGEIDVNYSLLMWKLSSISVTIWS